MNTSPVYDSAVAEEAYVFPASFTQQRLWFIDQLQPGNAAYIIPTALRLKTRLHVVALEQSLQEIVQRHEALRTTFRMIDEQLMQVIAPQLTVPLARVDLQPLTQSKRETEALAMATLEACNPFNLAQGPLVRFTLLQLAAEDHILLVTMHHSVSDGWSIGVFLKELMALYEAFSNGQPSPLPALPIQYADFSAWQQEWLQGETLAEQLAYWKDQLAEIPTTLELATDHLRSQVSGYRGSMHPFTLSKELTEALKTLSQQEGATLYMTLVAAFQTLLHRYTQQDDIVIGAPIAGRTQTEVEDLIGAFINTIVLRTDLSGNPTFRELLRRVREVVLDGQTHQDIPFEYLVKELQPERAAGQNPLFQALLSLEHSLTSLPEGWQLTNLDVDTGTSKFDLSLVLDERPQGIAGRFEYSADLFEPQTIARVVGHWQTLLESIAARPDQRLSELSLLTDRERHQLLVEWNATDVSYPRDQCVHQLFEAQVERSPDAVALILEGQEMTYRELNARANQLAHRLQQLGVSPDIMVGLCMDRSFDMVVSLLGILKAGGAYLPLEPTYPEERLAFMLRDTQAKVLLTQQRYRDLLPSEDMHVICLDTEWESITPESAENPSSEARAEDLAYIMYTSGSTGTPKGVEIRHKNINRLVFGANYTRLDETRTLLHMAPISFDASTLEIWGALLHGARCILFHERIPTPKSIGRVAHTYNVTTAWLTASLFNAVIDEAPDALEGIEQVMTGGETLSVAHIRRALAILPSTQLTNGYGPTESTTFTCCYPIPRHLSEDIRSIPIGRPINNTHVYILDRHLNPVPIGVPGELYIGGDGLARGYLHRPELTAERFIAHPFSDDPEARLYKTGDLTRYLPDGAIEFLGRLDNQVKLRGFRIELGEIEAVLGQHPAIREEIVVIGAGEHGDKYLVAYVVSHQGQSVTEQDLRGFLKERLPEYMIPSYFVQLESLSVTAVGKVDWRALPAPDMTRRKEVNSFVAPSLPVHYQLIEIWEDLLNVQPIGIRDNFFSLGGHSLLAARMVDRIEQVCGQKIPLSTLFAGATIEHLANVLQEEEAGQGRPGAQSIAAPTNPRAKVAIVQAGKTKRPFFFLHGDWYGGGFYCMNLARGLDPEQPFYALEPYEFDRVRVPLTFEAMAAAHIEAMRAVQPEGPYLLGGFCNGGLIAYEIARQLQAAGQNVDLLVLIDPASPHAHKGLRKALNRAGRLLHLGQNTQLNWFLRYLYMKIPAYKAKVIECKRQRMPEQLEFERKRGRAPLRLPVFDAILPATEALRYQWSGIYRWVAAGYQPGTYAGKLTLFWSGEAFAGQVNWRAISASSEVEDRVFPGTHMSSKNENLHVVAERLNEYLKEAQEKD